MNILILSFYVRTIRSGLDEMRTSFLGPPATYGGAKKTISLSGRWLVALLKVVGTHSYWLAQFLLRKLPWDIIWDYNLLLASGFHLGNARDTETGPLEQTAWFIFKYSLKVWQKSVPMHLHSFKDYDIQMVREKEETATGHEPQSEGYKHFEAKLSLVISSHHMIGCMLPYIPLLFSSSKELVASLEVIVDLLRIQRTVASLRCHRPLRS